MLYFGYGSLVNRHTRVAGEPFQKATLHGWQRQWAHRAARPWQQGATPRPGVCALTVAPAADSAIDGVVAQIDPGEIAGLDLREAGYNRISLPAESFVTEAPLQAGQVSVYVSQPQHSDWASADYPILMSYVDCVLAGFSQQFGDSGAQRFVQTTAGWNGAIFDDRKDPLYERAVTLTAAEQCLLDRLLGPLLHRAGA